jgi:hypothetical protein
MGREPLDDLLQHAAVAVGLGHARASGDADLSRTSASSRREMASRLARFDHDAIARTKSYVDQVTLPAESELTGPIADFRELFTPPGSRSSGRVCKPSGSSRQRP